MLPLDAPLLLPGRKLGRYELMAPAARGGMGEVWIARTDDPTPRIAALKTILPSHARDEKVRRMFFDEATIAARLDHPNVARVFDRGESDGVLYFAMEWVDGASLEEIESAAVRAGRRIAIPVLVQIVRDAALGLHAAHELRDAQGAPLDVVHRDVSPQNVLVRRDGVAKVTDFGIARARERVARTTTGNFRGKLRYVAPEQALGSAVDRRADVWSLAVLLYEGLSGQTPFEASHEAAILAQVLAGTPSFVFDADVPRELVAVLRRALARHPGARHATAAELASDLARVAARLGLHATASDVAAELEALLGPELEARTARTHELASRARGEAAALAVAAAPNVDTVPHALTVERGVGAPHVGRRWAGRVAIAAALAAGGVVAFVAVKPRVMPPESSPASAPSAPSALSEALALDATSGLPVHALPEALPGAPPASAARVVAAPATAPVPVPAVASSATAPGARLVDKARGAPRKPSRKPRKPDEEDVGF